jgi:hypothetical protein
MGAARGTSASASGALPSCGTDGIIGAGASAENVGASSYSAADMVTGAAKGAAAHT